MCLVLLAIKEHPEYPLMILSNRDEFYKRASSPADFWIENPDVFSGRDLVGNGTWLGVNRDGRFSLITNYRNPQRYTASAPSRGLLVSDFLLESAPITSLDYINKVAVNSDFYNPFNIVVGDSNNIYYYSNVEKKIKELSRGIYCMSNHLLNTPWYKVEKAKELFIRNKDNLLARSSRDETLDLLYPILLDNSSSPDYLLPDTGVGMDLEKRLSSIFVTIPEHGYGTYSSSIILFAKNKISFSEKIYIHGDFSSLKTTDIEPLKP